MSRMLALYEFLTGDSPERKIPPLARRGLPDHGLNETEKDSRNMSVAPLFAKTKTPLPPPVAVDREALEVEIKEGRLTVTPALARRILVEFNYERQRAVRRPHVLFLADEMRRGNFVSGSQLAFASYRGKLILTNGQHRLNAQIESQETVEYQVLVQTAENVADVNRLYYRQDRGGRGRTDAEVLVSVAVAERYGMTATMARATFLAQPLIAKNFARPSIHDDPGLRNDDLRLDGCRPWWPIAATYGRIIAPSPRLVRRKLESVQGVAVGLVTLKYQPEKASDFWAGVANDDGLRRDDPRKALLIDLASREWSRGSLEGAVAIATAWNAWFADRPLKSVHIYTDASVRINGTPYDGRRG